LEENRDQLSSHDRGKPGTLQEVPHDQSVEGGDAKAAAEMQRGISLTVSFEIPYGMNFASDSSFCSADIGGGGHGRLIRASSTRALKPTALP